MKAIKARLRPVVSCIKGSGHVVDTTAKKRWPSSYTQALNQWTLAATKH